MLRKKLIKWSGFLFNRFCRFFIFNILIEKRKVVFHKALLKGFKFFIHKIIQEVFVVVGWLSFVVDVGNHKVLGKCITGSDWSKFWSALGVRWCHGFELYLISLGLHLIILKYVIKKIIDGGLSFGGSVKGGGKCAEGLSFGWSNEIVGKCAESLSFGGSNEIVWRCAVGFGGFKLWKSLGARIGSKLPATSIGVLLIIFKNIIHDLLELNWNTSCSFGFLWIGGTFTQFGFFDFFDRHWIFERSRTESRCLTDFVWAFFA